MKLGPIAKGDPVAILREMIAAKLDEWAAAHQDAPEILLIWHPVVEVIDLQTGDLYLEAVADVIEKREPPFTGPDATGTLPTTLETLRANIRQAPRHVIDRQPRIVIP